MLYSEPDGVVQTLLSQRCHFVLPTVMDSGRTVSFMRNCVEKHGYRVHIVGVHVAESTGKRVWDMIQDVIIIIHLSTFRLFKLWRS